MVWNKFRLKEVIEEMKEEEKEKIIGKTVKDVIRSPEATKIIFTDGTVLWLTPVLIEDIEENVCEEEDEDIEE